MTPDAVIESQRTVDEPEQGEPKDAAPPWPVCRSRLAAIERGELGDVDVSLDSEDGFHTGIF